MSHKRLSQYTVIAGGKSSRIIEFSKGEAEIYVRNFIQARLSNAYVKSAGALQDLKGYFSDTKQIKEKLQGEISKLNTGISEALEKVNKAILNPPGIGGSVSGDDEATDWKIGNLDLSTMTKPAIQELQKVLEEASGQLTLAGQNIKDVVDDSDFNKEHIDRAKDKVTEAIENMMNQGITSLLGSKDEQTVSGDDSTEPPEINLAEEKRTANNNLNKLRKWQFDMFEEEFSAEIYVGAYHEYKYAKTIQELCEILTPTLKALGAAIELNPEDYRVIDTEVVRTSESGADVNIEEDIKQALATNHIEYTRIDVDWHDKNYDTADEPFEY